MRRGLAKHLPRLAELVRHSRMRELGILDTDKLLLPLKNVALGIGTGDNEWLDRTLALIAWFEQAWAPPGNFQLESSEAATRPKSRKTAQALGQVEIVNPGSTE